MCLWRASRVGAAAIAAVAVLAPTSGPLHAARPAGQASTVLVSAAASLIDALTAVAREYERATGVTVTLNFGGSSTLARQIVNGAPVDVFLSADEAQMDVLERAHLVRARTRVDLLANQLVVVEPTDRARPIATIGELASAGLRRIAAANPDAVPAGVYARRYLEAHGLWAALQPRIVPTLDVRAALAAVDSGNVDAAFVYRTDAAIARHATVVFRVPVGEGPRITYPAAVMAEAPNLDGAARFLGYVQSPAAAAIFERFGFLVVGRADAR